MANLSFQPGDLVVYAMPKMGPHPGPRARSIHPTEMGDDYSYVVDKYWMVTAVRDDGQLLVITRTGKTHVLNPHDPLLRKAGWWTRLRFRNRFPVMLPPSSGGNASPGGGSGGKSVASMLNSPVGAR